MEKNFKILGLKSDSNLLEIQARYKLLFNEYDADKSPEDLKEFFQAEQIKISKAFNELTLYLTNEKDNLKDLSIDDVNIDVESEKEMIKELIFKKYDDDELKNKKTVQDIITRRHSWWRYDDEYISGWQYFGRSFVGGFLIIILIGFYLNSVTAYKRAKSLGNSNTSCGFFGFWGGISYIIAFTPISFINILPHWYLWFSNGSGKSNLNE